MNIEELQLLIERDPRAAAALLDAVEREMTISQEPAYIKALHPRQYAFVKDPSPKKTALCSRRAGKSEGLAAWLLEGAEAEPNAQSVYIVLSRNSARGIIWRTMEDLNRRHNLGLKFREIDNQLKIETKNKHQIWLSGCKDSYEIEKFRGMKYKRAAIDEAASFGAYLRPLVSDVLEPALLDLQGQLALTGTPGAIPAGLFYEATTGDQTANPGAVKWPTHHWTVLDNPYVPHAADWLTKKRAENGWSEDHPTYLREWRGIWVRDDGALVYPFDERNLFYDLPEPDSSLWRCTVGIDIGYTDDIGIAVVAHRKGHPETFIVEAVKKSNMIASRLAVEIRKLQKKYRITDVVMDVGGIGKGYAEEISQRYGVHIEPAKKTQKRSYIELMRGELLSGNIKVHPQNATCLLEEWQALTWNEDRSEPDDRFEDHASDAALYAWRAIATTYKPETEFAPPSMEEAINLIAARHKFEATQKVKARLAMESKLVRRHGWEALMRKKLLEKSY